MKKIISRCPVCGGELVVTRLKCNSCETVIENNFRLSRFDYLSDEELYFTETFIRCRGNIKKMGYETQPDGEAERREEILKALEKGELTVEEAIEKLK